MQGWAEGLGTEVPTALIPTIGLLHQYMGDATFLWLEKAHLDALVRSPAGPLCLSTAPGLVFVPQSMGFRWNNYRRSSSLVPCGQSNATPQLLHIP